LFTNRIVIDAAISSSDTVLIGRAHRRKSKFDPAGIK
jgi:hypothetical protein